jgi:hypothetical protein
MLYFLFHVSIISNYGKTMDNGISSETFSPRLRRAASERIKGAKNFLKRVESFKSRKIKRLPKTGNSVEEVSFRPFRDQRRIFG